MALIANPQGTKFAWAGNGGWFGKPKIRMWCVPIDDCIAYPSPMFYSQRWVKLSNEGNRINPRWVALDRYNDTDWNVNRFTVAQCLSALEAETKKTND